LRDAKAPGSSNPATTPPSSPSTTTDSDAVAHLLLFYQTLTHNCIARAAAEARKAIAYRDWMVAGYGKPARCVRRDG
jgi:hypothetical protein